MPLPRPVQTWGLTHVGLAIRDPARSLALYRAVLGVKPVNEQGGFIQAHPGRSRCHSFRAGRRHGRAGGIHHIGFRLKRPEDIERAARAVAAASGEIRERGEFVPGEPYLFCSDPDGYTVEIWCELPTALDPPDPATEASPAGRSRKTRAPSRPRRPR